jgi:hypothetical protein
MKLDDYIHNEQIEWFAERTEKHINLVRKYACFLFLYDPNKFNGILQRAVYHDATKFSEEEILAYTVLSWKYKLEREGQTIDFPQEIQDEIRKATLHHIKNNRHHPFYFANDLTPEIDACRLMQDLDIGEQMCDWYAMAEERGTDPFVFAKENIPSKWNYLDEQVNLIYELLSVMKLYNEKYNEL